MSPEYMKIEQIEIGNGVGKPDPNGNINEKLQGLISGGYNPYRDTNWLVFNDNGKEKLISKKPLKWSISWNVLYKAGVVFGQEGIDDLKNADFSNTDYYDSSMGKDSGIGKRKSKTYDPTYVTINGKKYIVRLIRIYNKKIGINDNHDWNQYDDRFYNATKGSEWNRLILPLIDPAKGRYGSGSKKSVESNMPVLARYSWWTDLSGKGNLDTRWAQETGRDGSQYRAVYGSNTSYYGAASVGRVNPKSPNDGTWDWGVYNPEYFRSWQPVLEEIK